jgi:hypothetical protein
VLDTASGVHQSKAQGMATPSNKPRDIKDLKARLGRTMTPGQVGGSAPPGPGASVPAPKVGGSLPPPAVRNPLSGPPVPGAQASVPAPPFAQPGRQQAQPSRSPGPMHSAHAPAGRPAAGPFDVMATPQQAIVEKKVKLVIDDSAVKSSEVGRKSANFILLAIGLGLGVAAGFGIGSTGADRKQYNMAVRDGKDIYKRIGDVSKVLETAEGHLNRAVAASQGGPGKQAGVDYKAIEDLRAMERPFSAAEFSRRRYLAFPTPVVDDLFEYYNNVNLLWDKFEILSNKIAGDRAREALDKSAKAAEELIATDYGVVLAKGGDSMIGGIVVARPKPPEAGKTPKEGDPQIVLVSSRDGGREVERTLFTGQDDFLEKYDNYVVMVDKSRSMGTLGVAANLFGQLRGEITSTQALMGRTKEVQGRLIKELGKVAALQETGLF